MIAGTLEIQMMADMARLADDMNKAKHSVGGAMMNIERSVTSAKSVLASLGVGLSIGYFAHLVKGSIDAADHLRDLSKSTSIAVEQLAGLRLASLQSGGDLNSISAAINKLSQNMGKDGDKFAKLGIMAKEPIEAFKQLADVFVAVEDPQLRAAVMAEALGKSWAGAAPLLAEGGKRIGEMVDEGIQLAGVHKEMTDQADLLNDKLAKLTGTGGLLNRQIAPLLPIMNLLADDMLAVQFAAHRNADEFSLLAETVRPLIMLGVNFVYTWSRIGSILGGTAAQLNALAHGNLKEVSVIQQMMIKDAEEALLANDAWNKKMLEVGTTARAMATTTVSETQKMSQGQLLALHNFVQGADKIEKEARVKYRQGFDPDEDFWFAVDEAGMKNRKDAREKSLQDALAQEVATAKAIEAANREAALESTREWVRFTENVQRNLGDVLYDNLNGNFRDIGDLFKQMLLRMAADAAAANLTQSLFGSNGFSLSPLSTLMGMNGGMVDPITGMADAGAVPYGGSYAGGGFTGYGPRAGGLDGRGGFPAILHPNETVIDHTMGQSGGGGNVYLTYAPVTNIDARSDIAQVQQIADASARRGSAELVDRLQRQGAL